MSAVILAVIVVMWAVVLVPMWLRRHDATLESRSVDRFSTAMRVLSRRSSAAPDRRYILMPRRSSAVSVHVSGASAPVSRRPSVSSSLPVARAARSGRASLAVRRRRVLLGLLGLVGLTFLLAVAGVLGWLLQVFADLLLAGFVVHLRTQVKRAAAVSRQRSRVAVAPAARPAVPVAASAVPVAAEVGAVEVAPVEVVETVPVEAPAEAPAEVVQTAEAADGSWEPVPVPPPTYTMKPPAPVRRYAPIEETAVEAEEVAAHLADAPAAPVAPAAAEVSRTSRPAVEAADDDELDEILTRRWAVND